MYNNREIGTVRRERSLSHDLYNWSLKALMSEENINAKMPENYDGDANDPYNRAHLEICFRDNNVSFIDEALKDISHTSNYMGAEQPPFPI